MKSVPMEARLVPACRALLRKVGGAASSSACEALAHVWARLETYKRVEDLVQDVHSVISGEPTAQKELVDALKRWVLVNASELEKQPWMEENLPAAPWEIAAAKVELSEAVTADAAASSSSSSSASSPSKRKRPARDLREFDVLYSTPAVEPDLSSTDERFRDGFQKIRSLLDWIKRLGFVDRIKEWTAEIVQKKSGPSPGVVDAHLLTPSFKKLRTEKDVANALGILVDVDEAKRKKAFEEAKSKMKDLADEDEKGVPDFLGLPRSATIDDDENEGDDDLPRVGATLVLRYPIQCGQHVRLRRLGHIVDHPNFVTTSAIFPVGYETECEFFSQSSPGKMSTFRCKIVISPEMSPVFRVTQVDQPKVCKEGKSPSEVWSLVIADILIGMHEFWNRKAEAVRESELALNTATSSSSGGGGTSKGKDVDESKKIQKEVKKVLNSIVKQIENGASPSLTGACDFAAAKTAVKPVSSPVARLEKTKPDLSEATLIRKRRCIDFEDLVHLGKIQSGPNGPGLQFSYESETFNACVDEEGGIVYEGTVYKKLPAFTLAMKRSVKPDAKSDDGWKTIMYEGEPLDAIRRVLTQDELRAIEARRGTLDTSSARKKAQKAAKAAVAARSSDGISDKNYLSGAPNLEKLPRPGNIDWWQVDLTPMLNEQLGIFLFGLEHPDVLNALEALPLLDSAEEYRFRSQRVQKEKEDKRLLKRVKMLEARVNKARARIEKHNETMDKRIEIASRRHMRLEDKSGKTFRSETKKKPKLDGRDDEAARIKEHQAHLETIKELEKEVMKNHDGKTSTLKMEIEERAGLMAAARKNLEIAAEAAKDAEMMPSHENTRLMDELKKAQQALEEEQQKYVEVQDRFEKSKRQDKAKREVTNDKKEKMKSELADIMNQISSLGESIGSKQAKELPDDLSLESAEALPLELFKPVVPAESAAEIIEIWDFVAKFASLLSLQAPEELEEGLAHVDKDGKLVAIENGKSSNELNEDLEESVNGEKEAEYWEDDEELAQIESNVQNVTGNKRKRKPSAKKLRSSPTPSTRSKSPVKGGKKGKSPQKAVAPQKFKKTGLKQPTAFLPEIQRALQGCDMHLLVPMHVHLSDMIFIGAQGTHEGNMSDAARDRSLAARRNAPLNEATWPELLRYFFILQVRQLELGRETQYFKEILHHDQVSVSCAMSRYIEDEEDDDDDDNDNDDDEVDAENAANPGGISRRQARRNARKKLIKMRALGMQPVIRRLLKLDAAPYSGSESAETLMQYPIGSQLMPTIQTASSLQWKNADDLASTTSGTPSRKARSGSKFKPGNSVLVPVALATFNQARIRRLPKWARLLMVIRDLPTNRGTQMRMQINKAIDSIPDELAGDLGRDLQDCLSGTIFKSNAAGPCKKRVLEILQESLRTLGYITPEDEQGAIADGDDAERKDNQGLDGEGELKKRKAADLGSSSSTPLAKKPKTDTAIMADAESLRMDSFYRTRCQALVRSIGAEESAAVFCFPVDVNVYDDYLNFVTRPMDLQTIDRKIQAGDYSNCGEVYADIEQIWENCRVYNLRNTAIYKLAGKLATLSRSLFRSWVLEDDSMQALYPYIHEAKVPPPPWGEDNPKAVSATEGEKPKKRKKKNKKHVRAVADDYSLSEKDILEGFRQSGEFYEDRVARRVDPNDPEALQRGTIVAVGTGDAWRVKFDDDGDLVDMDRNETIAARELYQDYANKKHEKKRKRKEKKKKKKEKKGDGSDEDGDDEDGGKDSLSPVAKKVKVENEEEHTGKDKSEKEKQSTELPVETNGLKGDEEDDRDEERVPEAPQPPADGRMLSLEDDIGRSWEGAIVLRYFEELGCCEGVVTSYDPARKLYSLLFIDKENLVEEVSESELVEMEAKSALMTPGSQRNGVEDEEKELERLDSLKTEERRHYRKEGLDPDIVGNDMLAPSLNARSKDAAMYRRFVIALGTKSYEELDHEMRVSMLKMLCEHACESGVLREEIDRRLAVDMKTRQAWFANPPTIEVPPEEEDPTNKIAWKSTPLDPTSAINGVSEDQIALEARLAEFKLANAQSMTRSLLRAIERFERDIEKQKVKQKQRSDAKRLRAELEWRLNSVATRPTLLGVDRFYNRYMFFSGDSSRLFINLSKDAEKANEVLSGNSWFVVEGFEDIINLLSSLNTEGQRESALLAAIQDRAELFHRGLAWEQEAKRNGDGGEVQSLVGQTLSQRSKDGAEEPRPSPFNLHSRSSQIIGAEAATRNQRACVDASPKSLSTGSSFEEKCLIELKAILLHIELAIRIMKPEYGRSENKRWLFGLRKGWIRLVTSAANWRDLRQATCTLEVSILENNIHIENWFGNLYGDPGFALRTKTSSALAVRINALDRALLYSELARLIKNRIKRKL